MHKPAIALVTLLALAFATSGCLTMGTNNITEDRLSRGLLVYVGDSGDAMNRGWKAFEDGVSNRGVSLAFENFAWSPTPTQMAFQASLFRRSDSGEAARDLMRDLRHYAISYPGRPVYVVGHGVGCHIALSALDQMDPRFGIDRLVLLSPNIDSHRNLSTALSHVRDRCAVFYAWQDILHGVVGPFTFGTHDTARSRPMMAARGVKVPEDADFEQYEKLHVYGWRIPMALRGNLGGHTGTTSPLFVRKYVVPFIFDGFLNDSDADDLGPIPD